MGNDSHVHRLLDNAHISPDTRKRFAKYINNDTVVTMSSADTPYENLWQQLEPIVTNPYFSPGLADDLSRLPRTLILSAGQDPLHDDGKIYAKRLKDSGNDVTHRDYPSAQHGIYRNINTEINREMRQAIKEFLLRHLWWLLIMYILLNETQNLELGCANIVQARAVAFHSALYTGIAGC